MALLLKLFVTVHRAHMNAVSLLLWKVWRILYAVSFVRLGGAFPLVRSDKGPEQWGEQRS